MGFVDKKIEEKLKPALQEALKPMIKQIIEFTKNKAAENQKIMIQKVDELKKYIDKIVEEKIKEILKGDENKSERRKTS